MSYLKNLAKRADEPFRPSAAKAEEVVLAPDLGAETPQEAAAETDLGKPAKTFAPVLSDEPEEIPEQGEASSLMEAVAAQGPDLYRDIIRQVGNEPVKAVRHLSAQGIDADFDATDVEDYMIGAASGDNIRESLGRVATYLQVAPPTEAVGAELEKQGRKSVAARTIDDVVADVVGEALKRELRSRATAAGADEKVAKTQATAKYKALLDQVAETAEEVKDQRGAEVFLANLISNRLSGSKDESARQLHAVGRRAVRESIKMIEPSLFGGSLEKLEAYREVPFTDIEVPGPRVARIAPAIAIAERLIDGALGRQTERASLKVSTDEFVERIFNDAVIAEDILPKLKPKFHDVKQSAPAARIKGHGSKALSDLSEIPPEAIAGIAHAESNDNPSAFAYNYNISKPFMTPEQVIASDAALRAIGLDPSRSSYYKGDARRAIAALVKIAPAAAVKGGAWGRYQVLGRDGDLLG